MLQSKEDISESLKVVKTFKRLMRLLYFSTAAIFAVIFYIVLFDINSELVFGKRVNENAGNQELYINIMNLDEVLTMSARMAAVTGDSKWEKRYLHYEPILDSYIKKAIKQYTDANARQEAHNIYAANLKMVEMEKQTLSLVRANAMEKAKKIINSNEYEAQKILYAGAMRRLFTEILPQIENETNNHYRQWGIIFITLFPAFLLLGICIFFWRQGRVIINYHLNHKEQPDLPKKQLEINISDKPSAIDNKKDEELLSISKTEFMAKVNRELKIPVRNIIGFANMGVDETEKGNFSRAKEYFKHIFAHCMRLDILISDMLDVSKIESGNIEFDLELYSLKDLVGNAVSATSELIEKKNITVEVAKLYNEEQVLVDAKHMQQIFINLMKNAINCSPEGGVISWEFRISEMSVCGSHLMVPSISIIIEDQGPGIDPEQLENIFDCFIHSNNPDQNISCYRDGLDTARKYLNVFHGTINAANSESGGAVFEIRLPLWLQISPDRRKL